MTTALAAGLSLYALYLVVGIVQPQVYRVSFLLITLTLTFLLYPASQRSRSRITPIDWLLIGLAGVALGWPIVDLNQFVYRAATPNRVDHGLGIATTVLILEATRRPSDCSCRSRRSRFWSMATTDRGSSCSASISLPIEATRRRGWSGPST